MDLEIIGLRIWNDLIFEITIDRNPNSWSVLTGDPEILNLEKKAFYQPDPHEYILSQGPLSYGGKFLLAQGFSSSTMERFCNRFLYNNENIKKFKEIFSKQKHPGSTHELIDDIAASILVYEFTERITDSIQKGEGYIWGDSETTLLKELLENDIKLRAYSGISNIIPDLSNDGHNTSKLDLRIRIKKRGLEARIRLPCEDDFPKYIEVGTISGDDEILNNRDRPILTPSSIIISVEENVIQVPLLFHKKKEYFFMMTPNFYTPIVPFDLSFQWVRWKLKEALNALGLLQSVTCPNYTIQGFSIYLGNRVVYNYHKFIKNSKNVSYGKFYEWNLKDERKLKSTKNLLQKLLEDSMMLRIYEFKGSGIDGDKLLRNGYGRFNDIVNSGNDDLYKLRMIVEALEKFFSNGKNSKADTENGLKHLVNLLFDDTTNIVDIFNIGYCLRNKYTHYEPKIGDLGECLKKFVRELREGIDTESYYNLLVSSLYKTHLELLRQTILTCLISPLTADEFSEAMRNGRFEKIPKNIKSLVPEETYIDDIIKLRIIEQSNIHRTA